MMVGRINLGTNPFPSRGESLLFITFEDTLSQDKNIQLLNTKTQGKLQEKIKRTQFEGKENQLLFFDTIEPYQILVLAGAGKSKEFTLKTFKNILGGAVRQLGAQKIRSTTLFSFEELGKDFFAIGKNLALGFHLGNYRFNTYKSEKEKKEIVSVEQLHFNTEDATASPLKQGIAWGTLIAQGIALNRDLVNEPASHINPEALVKRAFEIEKQSKGQIRVEVLDEDECRRLGMGAYLAVSQGSDHKPKFIILHYEPKPKSIKQKTICLIGKSVTFDSGGLSLKPSQAMEDMKIDMAGGAGVLGIFHILAHLNPDIHGIHLSYTTIHGVLPSCENMPSGKALRPGDIVSSLNGKTIEVLNTDAEGRLTLADALAYAEKYFKPDIVIDLATLTGACMVALGTDITGLFGNHRALIDTIKTIAEKEGDEVWELPLHKQYLKLMKSEIADLKNIGGDRYGGAITAALFLSEFVKKSAWIHFDIGPAYNNSNPQGIIPKGATGWGITSIITFLASLYEN